MTHLFIGAGRVGRNVAAYAERLGIAARLVGRSDTPEAVALCAQYIDDARVVCLSTPDSAIVKVFEKWRDRLAGKTVIHFSGALSAPGLWSFHPLFSFPTHVLPHDTLAAIPFAVEPGAPALDSVFPGAPNSTFVVAPADRALYHALAVVSGNFAAHLWNETAATFAARFPGAPPGVLADYLTGVLARFRERPTASATGPVARRDAASIDANLTALRAEPRLYALYRAYLASDWPAYFDRCGADDADD